MGLECGVHQLSPLHCPRLVLVAAESLEILIFLTFEHLLERSTIIVLKYTLG